MADGQDAGLAIRKFPRRVYQKTIGVLAAGFYFLTQAVELGEGGLSFLSDERIEPGTIVVLTFQIPSGAFISTTAEIRHVSMNKQGAFVQGCLFSNIKFEHKREIRTYVSERS